MIRKLLIPILITLFTVNISSIYSQEAGSVIPDVSMKNILYKDIVKKLSELDSLATSNIFIKVSKKIDYFTELHKFYCNDSLLIHESNLSFNFDFRPLPPGFIKPLLRIKRMIDFKNEKIFVVYPTDSTYSSINFVQFREIYEIELQAALDRNNEKHTQIYRPINKRRMTHMDQIIKNVGYWNDRFNWETDTVLNSTSIIGSILCTDMEVSKFGEVKEQTKDTLIYSKKFLLINGDTRLELFNNLYSKLLNLDNYNFWQKFMLNYHWHYESLGFDVDTSSLDFIIFEEQSIPVFFSSKINVNLRERNLNSIETYFASAPISTISTFYYYKNDLAEITDVGFMNSLDTIILIPDGYKKIEFNANEILHFFQSP